MSRYIVQWSYQAGPLRFSQGQEVELTDEVAGHVNRDSKGVLVPVGAVVEPEPEERAQDEGDAPDRMVREAKNRAPRRRTKASS